MADGEINVAVQAEGVDEAAGELGGDGAGAAEAEEMAGQDGGDGAGAVEVAEMGGGDGGDGDGGGGGGRFGQLLARIATLLVFLGPILDVLGAVSKVLTAFVAPLAVLLMRLLAPVLRIMIKVLPVWFAIMDVLDSALKEFINLRTEMVARMLEFLGIRNPIESILGIINGVQTGIDNLPTNLSNKLADVLPGVDSGERVREAFAASEPERGGFIGSQLAGPAGAAVGVAIEGGLGAFVENVNRDENVNVQ